MSKSIRRRGFTLPEVLVTVTVVAVLAAVVVPAVTQYATRGDAPASLADIATISTGVTGFISDVRKAPGDLRQLQATIAVPTSAGFDTDAKSTSYTAADVARWAGPYAGLTLETGVFTSRGLNFKFGPTLKDTIGTNITGYLVSAITQPAAAACADILALKQAIDGTTDPTQGRIVWKQGATACAPATVSTASAVDSLIIRLLPTASN